MIKLCTNTSLEDLDKIKELLKSENVKLDKSVDMYGNTLLHHVFQYRRSDTIEELVTVLVEAFSTANTLNNILNIQNKQQKTPLHYACQISRELPEKIICMLITEQNINLVDRDGSTALFTSCRFSNTTSTEGTVKILLDRGADINKANFEGYTPLMISCKYSRTKSTEGTVKLLLNAGADVKKYNINKWTALMFSCENSGKKSTEETVRMLLEKNSDKSHIDMQNSDRSTALDIACINSRNKSTEGTVTILLDAGANINTQDSYRYTPLMHASKNSSKESTEGTVKLLLNAGADLNLKQHEELTALMLACQFSGRYSSEETVTMLLNAGADLNIQTINGDTVLTIACKYSKTYSTEGTVTILLDKIPNNFINIQNKEGYTALMISYDCILKTSTEKTVEMLLNRCDNDFTLVNKYGSTLLHIASRAPDLNKQLFKTVLDRLGCTVVNRLNSMNKTPLTSLLENSVKNKDVEFISLMLEYIDNLTHKDQVMLHNMYPHLYNIIIRDRMYKEFAKTNTKFKLIKFIPLRKQQIECYPTSYKVQLKGLLFDVNNGKQLMSQLFDSLDKKMKDYFNIKTVDDLIKIDKLI